MKHELAFPVPGPLPKSWKVEYPSRMIQSTPFKSVPDRTRITLKRKGTFAGQCDNFESVHTIELHHNYNGSGSQAFGGAEKWPVVTVHVAFNEAEEPLARDFAKDLAVFVDAWLARNGR